MRLTKYLALLTCSLAATLSFATQIEGLRVWPAPDHTRVVFDLSQKPEYKVFALGNPSRVVVDITEGAVNDALLSSVELEKSGISAIRAARQEGGVLRFVFDMSEAMKPNSFVLPPAEIYGDRLVIDLNRSSQSVSASRSVDTAAVSNQKRDIVIAIDAGHGGEDPGAIGPSRVREKDIVLAIARELYSYLEKEPGFKPVMIREGDYYVSLTKRRELARLARADFFISIHADSFINALASGASVFVLSDKGASSTTAKYLADRENATDLIGGTEQLDLSQHEDHVAEVLMDLVVTETRKNSIEVGAEVLEGFKNFARLHKKDVEYANFVVLKNPDIPSVLVETGFISNPTEEANLGSRSYRQKLAKAMKDGLVEFFNTNPPDGTLIAWEKQRGPEYVEHKVQSGDTLSGIAMRYSTSVAVLRQANSLKTDVIRVGQVIKIPRRS